MHRFRSFSPAKLRISEQKAKEKLAFLRFFLYLCIKKRLSLHPARQRQKPRKPSLLAAAARYSHARHKILPRPPQQFATGGAN
jgi:hypothetical protein